MDQTVEGGVKNVWQDTEATSGEFVRKQAQFRNWVTVDGAPGPSGEGGFPAQPGRYHLYVALSCPWAHRTLIFRKLKRLEDAISISVVHWRIGEHGWSFEPGPRVTPDTINHADYLREVYLKAKPDYAGRVTVPMLWDKERGTIVNNESSEIIRMLNSAFDAYGDASLDFYPEALREEIDAVNASVYRYINNGVYRCGFAKSQEAYEVAFRGLFATLDEVEERLSRQRYLVGDRITEADWRLFTTLVRFDPVYVGHFKCNLRRIVDYPNLSNYLRDLYQVPGIAETFDLDHTKRHYYESHAKLNPSGIVPLGPEIDYMAPHDRDRF